MGFTQAQIKLNKKQRKQDYKLKNHLIKLNIR